MLRSGENSPSIICRILHHQKSVALFIYFTLLCLQLISGNQERFVQMLNEPDSTETGRQGSGGQEQEAGGGSPGFIQVTPQEKEAIERVRCLHPPIFHSLSLVDSMRRLLF